jgi:hypothetical protein
MAINNVAVIASIRLNAFVSINVNRTNCSQTRATTAHAVCRPLASSGEVARTSDFYKDKHFIVGSEKQMERRSRTTKKQREQFRKGGVALERNVKEYVSSLTNKFPNLQNLGFLTPSYYPCIDEELKRQSQL